MSKFRPDFFGARDTKARENIFMVHRSDQALSGYLGSPRSTGDPKLEIEILPALSTANVREMLKAVLPLPQLSPEEAREQVIKHLVNQSRSTSNPLRRRQHQHVKVQT